MTQSSSQAALSVGRPRSVAFRKMRESLVMLFLGACGLFTIGITFGIIFVLLKETFGFFNGAHPNVQDEMVSVSPMDFFGSLRWSPDMGAEQHWGVWPLIVGTMKIVVIAMLIAMPLGMVTAIWLSEYARPRVRAVVKPAIEILAGVPTVVFGFFALTVLTPALRSLQGVLVNLTPWLEGTWFDFLHSEIKIYNPLSAGIAVGILCIPLVCSISEDALRAVPRALKEASYGLGATRFETSVKVMLPAALSGVVAAFLLAVARAVGETMVVALAAGSKPVQMLSQDGAVDFAAIFGVNDSVAPMTGYMVKVFTGEGQVGSIEYYSTYAVGATLFVLTLLITVIGNWIRKRFRQVYG